MALVVGKYYELQNEQFGTLLNLHGNHGGSVIPNGNKISLYPRTNDMDQQFRAEWYAGAVKLTPKRNAGYVLNRHSGDNSVIAWPAASAAPHDTEIDFITVNAAQNLYRLKLPGHNFYLTATGTQGICYWRTYNGNNTQIFRLVDPDVPLGLVLFEGFIRSHAGAGYNLNVYGNNTIADNRNVNVWSHTGDITQRWRIQRANGQYKIFSMLQYSRYALNVWLGQQNMYNCDVLTHTGNDNDSHVSIEAAGSFYRIKLVNHGLYLTAQGPYSRANVYWAPYSAANAGQVWAFTTSAPTAPPNPPTNPITGADSTLVNEVVPASVSNYWHDRNAGGYELTEITIHHAGYMNATASGVAAGWANPARGASSHYIIEDDNIIQCVREADMSWCNGGSPLYDQDSLGYSASNRYAITIEVVNDTYHPDWSISNASLNSLIALVADIAQRNGLGKLTLYEEAAWEADGQPSEYLHVSNSNRPACNLTWHSIYTATTCPGPYIRSKLLYIRDRANQINGY